MGYLDQRFGLEGKTAIITGGSGTLCGAMAEGMAQAGAKVILWARRPEALEAKAKAISECCGDPTRVGTVEVDLMDEEAITDALTQTIDQHGPVHILMNGAGGNRGKAPLTEVLKEDLEFVLKLNLLAGCILPTKHVSKYWIDNELPGNVINIASMAGYNPLSGVWAYSASKAAVLNQTMAHAKALAPHRIRVNGIAPGFFIADQNRRLLLNEDESLTDRGQAVINHTPAGKFGNPDDLIGAAIYLGSEASSFVTGVTIPVDGGYLCDNI